MTTHADENGHGRHVSTAGESVARVVRPRNAQWTGLRRGLALTGAALSLILGGIGLLLPVVPTTPFVLLASWLLLRSSSRLHHRLINSRMFGGTLRTWEETRSITRRIRNYAIAVVVIGTTGTLLADFVPWPLRLLTACGAAIGIRVILRLPLQPAADCRPTAAVTDEMLQRPPAVPQPVFASSATADRPGDYSR